MPKMQLLFLLFATVVIAATTAQADLDNPVINNQISLLRRHYGSVGSTDSSCLSWRFGVETNNIIGWTSVPEECELYVGQYMLGHQYRKDSKVVTKQATHYAKSLTVSEDGKDMWIFEMDETVLSNQPYYAKYGFGVQPFNPALFDEWVRQERAPALPKSYKLYKKLLALGFKIVFLSERHEDQRATTENNLRIAGFRKWEQIILKQKAPNS